MELDQKSVSLVNIIINELFMLINADINTINLRNSAFWPFT